MYRACHLFYLLYGWDEFVHFAHLGEHYRNEVSADRFKKVFLLDTKLIFHLNKRMELSADLNNLLNRRTYNYTVITSLTLSSRNVGFVDASF